MLYIFQQLGKKTLHKFKFFKVEIILSHTLLQTLAEVSLFQVFCTEFSVTNTFSTEKDSFGFVRFVWLPIASPYAMREMRTIRTFDGKHVGKPLFRESLVRRFVLLKTVFERPSFNNI